jgi:hypothetical protein
MEARLLSEGAGCSILAARVLMDGGSGLIKSGMTREDRASPCGIGRGHAV